jgi:hypothetical protein
MPGWAPLSMKIGGLPPAGEPQHRVFAGEEIRFSDWEIRNGN